MLTRSAILATTLAIGLVTVVGSSALAVAFVPGNESGSTQDVPAIAIADQDPAEGTSSAFLAGVPAIVAITAPIVLDAPDEDQGADVAPVVEVPATDSAPPASVTVATPTASPTPSPSSGNNGNSGNGNSGNGNSNSGSGNSGNGNSGNGNSNSGSGNSGSGNKDKKDKDKKDKKDKKDAEVPADQAE
jgi:uncharacterized membrane protein YgcG